MGWWGFLKRDAPAPPPEPTAAEKSKARFRRDFLKQVTVGSGIVVAGRGAAPAKGMPLVTLNSERVSQGTYDGSCVSFGPQWGTLTLSAGTHLPYLQSGLQNSSSRLVFRCSIHGPVIVTRMYSTVGSCPKCQGEDIEGNRG